MTKDEQIWKQRFFIYMAMRALGVGIFFLGIAVIFTDLLRPGGWPQVGAILAIVGVIDAFFAPRMIKKSWERSGE